MYICTHRTADCRLKNCTVSSTRKGNQIGILWEAVFCETWLLFLDVENVKSCALHHDETLSMDSWSWCTKQGSFVPVTYSTRSSTEMEQRTKAYCGKATNPHPWQNMPTSWSYKLKTNDNPTRKWRNSPLSPKKWRFSKILILHVLSYFSFARLLASRW